MTINIPNPYITRFEMNRIFNIFGEAKNGIKTTLLASIILIACFMPTNSVAQDPCVDNCDIISLACNSSINVSINENCYAAVTADLILEDPPFVYCPDSPINYSIDLFDENGIYIPGHVVGLEHVNTTIKASISLIPCSISCWGYINVEDKVGPKIIGCVDGFLPPVILDCFDYTNGIGPDEPDVIGFCDYFSSSLTFVDDTSNVMCVNGYAVSILRTWTAIDEAGFTDVCQQEIFVEQYILKDIEFPDDYIVEYTDDCDIFNDVSPELTGYPLGAFCPNIQFYWNDIEYSQCGVQRKLLREWFVLDWCTGESVSRGQVIKIIDNSSPIVECPSDTILYPADWYHCVTDVILDPYGLFDTLTKIKVVDECSLPISVTVEYLEAIEGITQPKTGDYYPVEINEDSTFTIPSILESVWVRYCYSDDCGNRSSYLETIPELIDSNLTSACCYFEIQIDDQEPPTAICEGYTKVQLTSTGVTEIFAETFDDASFDPCGDVAFFEVKRENSSCPSYPEHGIYGWGPSVHFCCEDLGETITVRMRAYDINGNYSECLGIVTVRSHATPKVECPADIDLDCGADYTDRDIIGIPTGENGCDSGINIGADWFDIQDYDLSCGTGTIYRQVDVIDDDGNVLKNCNQRIYIDPAKNTDALEVGDFTFPVDVTIDECAFGPNIHPEFTGKPIANKLFDCTNIAISYKDEAPYTTNNNGVCYKILRTWKIVDWCRFNPHYPHAYTLSHVQEINISNSGIVIFTCPQQDIIVNATSPLCEAYVDLGVTFSSTCNASMSVSWEIDAFSNGTIDYVGNGNDASDIYPVGEHKITYYAVNHCGGGQSSCTIYFNVVGDKEPTPICRAELVWTMGYNQETIVWASDFDLKSVGGCNGLDNISFSFVDTDEINYPESSRTFTCSDIPNGISETIQLDIFVIDEAGLSSSCHVFLQLQDTQDYCPDLSGMAMIAGEILTEKDEPIEEVMVELLNMNEEGSDMEMTNITGAYAFENIENNGQYKLLPYNDDDPLNGVSTLDLLMIQSHILGQNFLDSPYKLIAADIDANGSISAIDLIQLRKLILGIYESYPENESWVFVPEKHTFLDPLAPWNYPSYLDLLDVQNSEMEADFIGIKVGDVNNSIVINNVNDDGEIQRKDNSVFISTDNVIFAKGDLVGIPLRIEKDASILGMQFTISFDETALVFEGIDRGALDITQENFALLNSQEGTITVSIDDLSGIDLSESEILFTAYFESRIDSDIASLFDINSNFISAEIYNENYEIEKLSMVVHGAKDESYTQLEVFQNEPNPFDDFTSIAFSIPKRQKVALSIFDSNGSLIKNLSKTFDKGINEFLINASELNSNGVLFYRVESQSSIVTRKMIVVK